jgi:multiple sugar transport system substrate-binding protein
MATGDEKRIALHQQQTSRFKALTGHDVELIHVTGEYMDKLYAAFAAGQAPDIFRLESSYLPGLVAREQVEPLDAYLRRDRVDLEDFYPKGLEMYRWQDRQYALPWLAFRVLFYNVALLQQQGVARPPIEWRDRRWNWDAFLSLLRRFVQVDAPPQPGGMWPFGSPLAYLDAWVWVLGAGGDLFSADGRRLVLDQPAALEGLQFYADLMAVHRVHPTPSQAAQDPPQAAFLTGRTVFYYGPALVAARLRDVTFAADAAPVPWGKAGTYTTGGGHGWPMSRTSVQKEAAWQLQKFLGSKENDLLQVEAGEAPPFRKSTAALPAWRQRRPPEHPEVLSDSATYLQPQPKVPAWSEIERVLNTALRPVWEGQRGAREVVSAIKPQVEHLLEQGWKSLGP